MNNMQTNKTKALKEPLASSRFDFFVVELPFILPVHIVERSHLQPTRLQRESGTQFLQPRLLLVLKDVAMLSHLDMTKPNNTYKNVITLVVEGDHTTSVKLRLRYG